MQVVSSAAALTPNADGDVAELRAGGSRVRLTWNAARQVWVSAPSFTVRMIDATTMRDTSSGYIQQASPSNDPPLLNETGIGFQLEPVVDAKALWDAGLRLQERLSGELAWSEDVPSTAPYVYVNWYEFQVGSQFLSPVPTNPGVQLVGLTGVPVVMHFCSTGWQNSPVAAPSQPTWYPELYGGHLLRVGRLNAERRWACGAGLAGAGDADGSGLPPHVLYLHRWFEAEHIALPDGALVDFWGDKSGFHQGFSSSGSHRPSLARAGLNGRAYLSFDGVDDYMTYQVGAGQPFEIYLVMRQRAGGTSPQVWVDGLNTPFLIYRGDDTDQVDLYANGSGDLIYHRGSPWPSPWMVLSASFNGDATTVWENKTLKATGGAGKPGVAGPGLGLTLGARRSLDLFSALDVAEVVVYLTNHTTTERQHIVDWLNAKYGVF